MTEAQILGWLADYWPLVAGPIALLGGLGLWARRRPAPPPPTVAPDAPRAPLTPNRPDIVAAERNRFAEPPPPVSTGPAIGAGDGADAPLPHLAPATGPAQNLRAIKGIGPKLAQRLTELGITRYDQLAALTPAGIAALDAQLGDFAGRIERDRWVEQAGLHAAGDRTTYVRIFGAIQHEPGPY